MSAQSRKNCQSCGMPMKRDERGGGANADGTRSGEYCSHCYDAGVFRQPDITAAEMQARVKSRLKDLGFPTLMAGLLTRGIPKLSRWAKD